MSYHGQTDRRMDGRTDGQTDGQIQATTIPLWPERPRGKKPFGLKSQGVKKGIKKEQQKNEDTH